MTRFEGSRRSVQSDEGADMTEDELLKRFGVSPKGEDVPVITEILRDAAALERSRQGAGDTELMRLCCVQLFCARQLDSVLEIWGAKTSSMDADASIDIQLLCGAGLSRTKEYLAGLHSEEAAAALNRLVRSENAGDFDGFAVAEFKRYLEDYYGEGE